MHQPLPRLKISYTAQTKSGGGVLRWIKGKHGLLWMRDIVCLCMQSADVMPDYPEPAVLLQLTDNEYTRSMWWECPYQQTTFRAALLEKACCIAEHIAHEYSSVAYSRMKMLNGGFGCVWTITGLSLPVEWLPVSTVAGISLSRQYTRSLWRATGFVLSFGCAHSPFQHRALIRGNNSEMYTKAFVSKHHHHCL